MLVTGAAVALSTPAVNADDAVAPHVTGAIGPLPADATALTLDGQPVALASWFTNAGWQGALIGGASGSRTLSFIPTPASGTNPTDRPFGFDAECMEESYPVATVYKTFHGNNMAFCSERAFNVDTAGSGTFGLTFPLVANVFDATASDGRGDPVVLHDVQSSGGSPGSCGVGLLGVRSTSMFGRETDEYRPEFASYHYDRGVEVRRHVVLPMAEPEHGVLTPDYDERSGQYRPMVFRATYAPAVPDRSAPIVTVTSPADCEQFALGDEERVGYTCDDIHLDASTSPASSCSGPVGNGELLDTSAAGNHTFTVTGTDEHGNQRSRTVRYTVHDVDRRDLPQLDETQVYVRGLTPADGTNALDVGDRALLSVSFGSIPALVAPAPYPGYRKPSYDTFLLRGMKMTTEVYENELADTPLGRQLGCRAGAISTDSDGVTQQTVTCANYGGGTANAFLPVEATHPGVFQVGPGDGVGDLTVSIGNLAPSIDTVDAPIDPVAVGGSVPLTAAFTDPDVDDAHTCQVAWGDGSSSSGVVVDRTCSADHGYAAAGVYTLTTTVTDRAGASDSSSYEYVVVYDPSAGFVTGGGQIDSPPGAYTPDDPDDPDASGQATFAFLSKYRRGSSTPDGSTQFAFRAAGLDFRSTSYDWLVVSGARAQYKGTGTIGGRGDYGFVLTATDGDQPGGGSTDRFRIKIWDKTTGANVYDNQAGADDTAEPATAITAGSIRIHRE